MNLLHDTGRRNDLDLVQPAAVFVFEFDAGYVPGKLLPNRLKDRLEGDDSPLHLPLTRQIVVAAAIIGFLGMRRRLTSHKPKRNESHSQMDREGKTHVRIMADPTCRNDNKPRQPIDRGKRLPTSRARGSHARCPDGDLIMKRTMAAVIVGPTIEPPVSVFASAHERCGTTATENWLTTNAVKAGMAEQGYEVRAVKSEGDLRHEDRS